jgi:hypothetical protein
MRAGRTKTTGRPVLTPGTIIGKALDAHTSGTGVIEVFVFSS